MTVRPVDIWHFHVLCGLGGGAKSFSEVAVGVGRLHARCRCIGGIDADPAGVKNFQGLAPGPQRREATPQGVWRAAEGERPRIAWVTSPTRRGSA